MGKKKRSRAAFLLCIVMSIVMMLSAYANSDSPATLEPESDGSVFVGSANGYGGVIEVTITVEGGIITKCSISADDETPSVGGVLIEPFEQEIVETNGNIDAVSGATATSSGVIAALQNAMIKARLLSSDGYRMVAGIYTGEARGFSSINLVSVTVTVSEDSILSLELNDTFIDDWDTYENIHFCTEAFEILSEQILDQQSVGVDAVTGATGSSTGIKNAIGNALEQAFMAAGHTADEARVAINAMFMAPSPKKNEVVELHYDVVVVGAGGSGAIATLTALDEGANVLNIEKTYRWGGQSQTTGGPKAYSPDTTEEEAQAILDDYEELIASSRFGKEDTKWNDPDYRTAHADEFTGVNAEAYKAVVPASGNAASKLLDYGMKLGRAATWINPMDEVAAIEEPAVGAVQDVNARVTARSFPFVPDPVPITAEEVYDFGTSGDGTSVNYMDAEIYFNKVFENYVANGGNYLLSTTAKELIYEDESKSTIIGVYAVSDDGTEYKVYADCVILATGGFGANSELVAEWTPFGGGWKYYGWQGNKGAGILMALDAGANPYNLDAYPMSHQRMGKDFLTGFELQSTETGMLWSPNDLTVVLAINDDGVYLTTEGDTFRTSDFDNFSNAMGTYYLGSTYYVTYSAEQLEEYYKNGIDDTACGFQNTGEGVPSHYPLGDWIYKALDAPSRTDGHGK